MFVKLLIVKVVSFTKFTTDQIIKKGSVKTYFEYEVEILKIAEVKVYYVSYLKSEKRAHFK